MNFNEYQLETLKTAFYPHFNSNKVDGLNYPIIGLCGEAGELANKYKKVLRDHDGNITSEMRQSIE